MLITPRTAAVAAFGLASLTLAAGCGTSSGDGARTTISPIQPTSYVTVVPATTTTTTTIPESEIIASGISPTEQTYTVVAGDSISKIASRYDITMDALTNYNLWADGTNHRINPGDTVLIPPNSKIPGAATATPTVDATGTTAPPVTGQGCSHTIVAGDNPTRVAAKYDITVDELSNANLDNPVWNTFLIGSQLTIPPGGNC